MILDYLYWACLLIGNACLILFVLSWPFIMIAGGVFVFVKPLIARCCALAIAMLPCMAIANIFWSKTLDAPIHFVSTKYQTWLDERISQLAEYHPDKIEVGFEKRAFVVYNLKQTDALYVDLKDVQTGKVYQHLKLTDQCYFYPYLQKGVVINARVEYYILPQYGNDIRTRFWDVWRDVCISLMRESRKDN